MCLCNKQHLQGGNGHVIPLASPIIVHYGKDTRKEGRRMVNQGCQLWDFGWSETSDPNCRRVEGGAAGGGNMPIPQYDS